MILEKSRTSALKLAATGRLRAKRIAMHPKAMKVKYCLSAERKRKLQFPWRARLLVRRSGVPAI
jgi:hypothetical protein